MNYNFPHYVVANFTNRGLCTESQLDTRVSDDSCCRIEEMARNYKEAFVRVLNRVVTVVTLLSRKIKLPKLWNDYRFPPVSIYAKCSALFYWPRDHARSPNITAPSMKFALWEIPFVKDWFTSYTCIAFAAGSAIIIPVSLKIFSEDFRTDVLYFLHLTVHLRPARAFYSWRLLNISRDSRLVSFKFGVRRKFSDSRAAAGAGRGSRAT